jgi:hypothetical protein
MPHLGILLAFNAVSGADMEVSGTAGNVLKEAVTVFREPFRSNNEPF